MWKLINVQSQDYLINFEFGAQQSSLKVLISNFDNLWITEFDEAELFQTFKKFNPLIELDQATLMNEMANILIGKRDDVSWDIQTVETTLKLKLKSTFARIPFRFEIDFNLINNSLLFRSIILPLLILVKGMQKQKDHLCDIIRKKDMEITEYKLDGAVLSRKTVETPQFDESVLSRILNENLEIVSSEKINSLLDDNVTQHLDKINRLLCEEANNKTSETEKVPVKNEASDLSEPPKKRLMNLKTESKVEPIDNVKLQKPTIKKITKVRKRLQNL